MNGPIGILQGIQATLRQNEAFQEYRCAEQGVCVRTGTPPLAAQRLSLIRLLQVRELQLLEQGANLIETVGFPETPFPSKIDPSNPPPLPPNAGRGLRARLIFIQSVRTLANILKPLIGGGG
jgi:hypothetical protein